MSVTNFNALVKNKWVLVLGVLGVLLLLFGSAFGGSGKANSGIASAESNQNPSPEGQNTPNGSPTAQAQLALAYETQFDKQLENILSKIDGINHVNVMATVDSTEILKLANNDMQTNSTQKNGQTTSTSTTTNDQIFTTRNSDGSMAPVVVERVEPQVRGVLVTVAANDFTLAKAEIIESIQNVLDVPAYKISVEPQKVNE